MTTPATKRPPRWRTPARTRIRRDAKPVPARKQALLIAMLRREEGATIDQIAEATGWQRHTCRGAISGTLKKRLGLNIISEKTEGAARIYRICD